jgi:DNA-binding NtrC family response regulator
VPTNGGSRPDRPREPRSSNPFVPGFRDAAIEAGECFETTILTVFPATPVLLREIFHGLNWRIHEAQGARDVMQFLSERRAPVILCHCSFADGNWRDLVDCISGLPCPPRLVVTSELADDLLWAEVLNLGGYDVIAQPFRESEVVRTLTSALRQWSEEAAAPPGKTARPICAPSCGTE